MITPFRRYKTIVDWINPDTKSFQSCIQVINLYNVEEYCTVDNTEEGFNDLHRRVCVLFENGNSYKLRISFEEFDALMMEFLQQDELLDNRSMIKKKDELENVTTARMTYNGPIDFHFNGLNGHILCNAYPKDFRPKSIESGIRNILYSNLTPLN